MAKSIVEYFGKVTGKCGYCTGTNCSKTYGMHAYCLSCKDYQNLMDRGWRRCGNYCYKPENEVTCCPCYTIKCNALEFKLSKSNKRILRRMAKFLRDGKREAKDQEGGETLETSNNGDNESNINMSEVQPELPDRKPTVIDVEHVASMAPVEQSQETRPLQATTQTEPTQSGSSSTASNQSGAHASNPPRKKAKQMRMERRQAKLGISSAQEEQPKPRTQEKSLRDFLDSAGETDKHKLTLRLVNVHSEEFMHTLSESYELYRKYQITIHNDPPRSCKSYQDHLQVSPIKHQKPSDGPDQGYGSFHQQYWLDDKLIAVGVIDILPSSISSVYFFYDPDYSFLSLGTYGSLREIDLVEKIAAQVPELKCYYMGFYIHSCPKMRYKGKLSASYLLCPETYLWLELTNDIFSRLDKHKYQRLCSDSSAKDVDEFLNKDLDSVLLLLNATKYITYSHYEQLVGKSNTRGRDEIVEYGKVVGKTCAHRMIYVTKFRT